MKRFAPLLLLLLAQPAHAADDGAPTVTFDVGGSSGQSNGRTWTELQLGVNYHLSSWLLWRNAPFYRVNGQLPAAYGLDSSLVGHHTFEVAENFKPSVNLGGGYRFLNTGKSAPFAEGGLGLQLGGVHIAGSAKVVFNSAIAPGRKNDTIFTISFGGGGVVF